MPIRQSSSHLNHNRATSSPHFVVVIEEECSGRLLLCSSGFYESRDRSFVCLLESVTRIRNCESAISALVFIA